MSWLCSSFATICDFSHPFCTIATFDLNQAKLIFGCVCVVVIVCCDGGCGDGNHGHNNGGHHCVVRCYFPSLVALCGIGRIFFLLVCVEFFCYYFSWPWSCSFVFLLALVMFFYHYFSWPWLHSFVVTPCGLNHILLLVTQIIYLFLFRSIIFYFFYIARYFHIISYLLLLDIDYLILN